MWKDCTMTAKWFVKVATEEIIPAIRTAFERLEPRECTVTVNLDNARPHVGSGAIATINESGMGDSSRVKVKFKLQSPNSPDFNVCDLCLFPSWSRRNDKLQKQIDKKRALEQKLAEIAAKKKKAKKKAAAGK